MNIMQSFALLLTVCAATAYLNQRFFRWPPALAMNLVGILLALGLVALGHAGWARLDDLEGFIKGFDFSALVLNGILGLLLFAGALSTDIGSLRRWAAPIASLASVGVLVSATVTGLLVWAVSHWLQLWLPFWWCLLFGALISPTDPAAVLSIVRRAGAPKSMETKLVGEGLFNDATGVMLFLLVLSVVSTGSMQPELLVQGVFVAPAGAALLGCALGWLAARAMSVVDHPPTAIIITLALATSAYGLALALHLSAPIAAVAAGLFVGQRSRPSAMGEQTRQHLTAFWEGVDEVINATLFVLIGLALILVEWSPMTLALGGLAWIAVLIGRWCGVQIALLPMRRAFTMGPGTTRVMVWGGLRGGISLALALSLPPGQHTSMLVAAAFVVVALSVLIQGLTLSRVTPMRLFDRSEPSAD